MYSFQKENDMVVRVRNFVHIKICCLLANNILCNKRGQRIIFANLTYSALNIYHCIISNNEVIFLKYPISINIGAKTLRFFSNLSSRSEKGKYFGASEALQPPKPPPSSPLGIPQHGLCFSVIDV